MDTGQEVDRFTCPQVCLICRKAATGYHYSVPSCNGCKSFFRRTLIHQFKYTCSRNQNCFIELPRNYRLYCKFCRFERCISIGMNPMGIVVLRKDIQANRTMQKVIKKQTETANMDSAMILPMDKELENLIDELLYIELIHEKKEEESKWKDPWPRMCQQGEVEMCYYETLEKMLEPFQKLSDTWTLTSLLSTLNYATAFTFFRELTQEDKKVITKIGVLFCFHLTQAYYCSEKSFPKENLELSSLVNRMKNQIIDPMIRNQTDKKEYVILKAFLLYALELSEKGRESIERERNKFSKTLLTYSLSLDSKRGPAIYAANLAIIHSLEAMLRPTVDS